MYAIAIALCVLALSGASAYAQNQPTPAAPAAPAAPANPEKLPTSLDRIRKELAVPADKAPGIRIARIVEVVGVAPPIVLWTEEERAQLTRGPSRIGAPTHKEMLDLNTPLEFKRYPMDLNAVMRWLADKLGDGSSKERE
jgi:hypothetical protein